MESIRKMSAIISEAKRATKKNDFIEIKNGIKVFNYGFFSAFCDTMICIETNGSEGCTIRDIAMEAVDKNFDRNKPDKFLGMECI